MSIKRWIIVGEDEVKGELALLRVDEEEKSGRPKFSCSIMNANNDPEMRVHKGGQKILVTETSESHVLRMYVRFARGAGGKWEFVTGWVGGMKDGWVDMGVVHAQGKVVWDSGRVLDRILES